MYVKLPYVLLGKCMLEINFLTLPKLATSLCAFKKALGKMLSRQGPRRGMGWRNNEVALLLLLDSSAVPKLGSSDPSNPWQILVGLIPTVHQEEEYTVLVIFVRRHTLYIFLCSSLGQSFDLWYAFAAWIMGYCTSLHETLGLYNSGEIWEVLTYRKSQVLVLTQCLHLQHPPTLNQRGYLTCSVVTHCWRQ